MPQIAISSIMTPLRALLRDNAGQTNNEWTDSVLLGYITDGVMEAQRELSLADADYFLTVVTFNITSGQEIYTPATDIRKVIKIQRVDQPPPQDIPLITWVETLALDQWAASSSGPNSTFYIFSGDDIRLFPLPNTNIANAVRLTYEKRIVPAGGYTTTSTTVTLPDDWIRFVVYASACYALLQDEENPDTVYRYKTMLLNRIRTDFRDRMKGKASYVRYSGDGEYGSWW